ASEDAFVALILPEYVHALGFELGHCRIVGVAVDHEGVVNGVGKPSAAGVAAEQDIVGTRFEEHEMRILLRHLGHEFEPENIGVEGAAAGRIADRNGHVQNAFGLDHANLPRSDDVCHRAENFPSIAWRKFHARSTRGHRQARYFAEGISNLRLKPPRSAAPERSTSSRMHSWNVQLPKPIDDARRAPVDALHHRLDLRAGTRRVEPKPHLFALRQKVRIRYGGGERLA